jgi:hypothetical protein
VLSSANKLLDLAKKISEDDLHNKNNTNYISGNDLFSSQVITSDQLLNGNFTQFALDNNLGFTNLTDCIKTLKNYYNISESENLIINKIDLCPANQTDLSSKSVKIEFYDSQKQKLNMSLCHDKEKPLTYSIPLKEKKGLNMARYNAFRNIGIDIYNYEDPAFSSRCNSYQVGGFDITLNMRIKQVFSNLTLKCSRGCSYNGIDSNDYLQCNCDGLPDDDLYGDSQSITLPHYSDINADIIECSVFNVNIH